MTLRQFCEQAIDLGHPRHLWSSEGDLFSPKEFLTQEAFIKELGLEVKVEGDVLITFNRKGEPLTGSELYFKRPQQPEEEAEGS
ncbi:MAG TPA: hypothetical protein VGD78_15055 [Chthoniobacterales bacterium]